jgi:hypothetical protein
MPVGDLKNIDVKMLFRLVQVWWLMKKNDECPQMINQEELESYLGLRGKKVGGTLHEFVAKSKIGHYANLYIQTGMVNNWAQLEKAAQKGRNENAQDCKEKTSQAIHSMRKNIVQKKEASQSRIPRTG